MVSDAVINIDPQKFVNRVVRAALGAGLLRDSQAELSEERGDKQLIVVAAAPKSGSTFLANTLGILTGSRYFRLCSAYSTNEHDLYLPALCIANPYGCVSQLHIKGTFHNSSLMQTFGIRPVILVRGIYDVVVSLKNDLRQKEQIQGYATGQNGYSFLWQDQCTKGLSDDRLIDMIIDLAIPWYVNFYVSWYRLCEQGAVDAIWITYEQMMVEKEKTLRSIMDFLGYRDIGAIDEGILSKKYSKFRDGRTGQGVSELAADQKARIRERFSYYSGIDFSGYGI